MNPCPALPATGQSSAAILVTAAVVLALGCMTIVVTRWRRHAVIPVIVVAIAGGIASFAVSPGSAYAATCPPATSPAVTTIAAAPTTAAPETTATTAPSTTTATTTTTSTSTTTTQVPIAPVANDDLFEISAEGSLAINVLDNDDLGQPPAQITDWAVVQQPAGSTFTFDPATGALTYQPLGNTGLFQLTYTIANAGGSDAADVSAGA